MLEKVINKFDEYVSSFDQSDNKIKMKYNHSYNVSNLMAELAFRLDLSKEEIELAKIIGLLHDIGRFYQLEKYSTFSDSVFDHAEYGADYLFKEGHIRDFIDIDKYDDIIEKAIRLHNKLNLPTNLSKKEELFCKMIRDMDKIDIYKQAAVNNKYTFKSVDINEKILNDFKLGKTIIKNDAKSKSDFVMLYICFIYDINFNESFDILVETDNFDLFLSTIEVDADSEKLWKKVKELAFDKINRGV